MVTPRSQPTVRRPLLLFLPVGAPALPLCLVHPLSHVSCHHCYQLELSLSDPCWEWRMDSCCWYDSPQDPEAGKNV